MASVAAATSRGRCRRHEEQAKLRAMNRAKIANEQKELKARARYVFEDLSRDGEWLEESQFKEFFLGVFGARKLDKDALRLVVNTATGNMVPDDTSVCSSTSTGTGTNNSTGRSGTTILPKEALVHAVIKYAEYISQRKMVNSIFEKYDRAGRGKLGRSELLRLLQDKERKSHRAAKGVAIMLVVSTKDLEYILEQADADRDGHISRAELLPALAAWDELARLKMEQKQMAACCIIL